jgi:FdhE protein
MTRAAPDRVARLGAEHPEWRAWLAVLGRALRAAADPAWDGALAELRPGPDARAPRLAGAVFRLDAGPAAAWVAELMGVAAEAGGGAAPALRAVARPSAVDGLAVLEAAVARDRARLEAAAGAAGVDRDAFRAVAELSALPLLHAGRRRAGEPAPAGFREGYCPVCGDWPALAESRGVERARHLRCGRCGAGWATDWLRCPYCGTADHDRLGSLVPEAGGERRRVDTCHTCRGYVKTLATLAGSGPGEVALDDLASVDLDLAALAQGYRRPEGPACALGVAVVSAPGQGRRRWAWRR